MFNCHIEEMVDVLRDAEIVPEHLYDQAITVLRERVWTDKFAITWGTVDILDAAEQLEIELTDDEARWVLGYLHRNYSSSYGITNEHVENAIDEVVARRDMVTAIDPEVEVLAGDLFVQRSA